MTVQRILRLLRNVISTKDPGSTGLDAMVAQGSCFEREGQVAKAAEIYNTVLGLNPNHWEALNAAAELALRKGTPDVAIRLFDALIERNSTPAAHYKRANILNRLGRWDAALSDYDKALALDSNHAAAYCNRGSVLGQLGRWDEALASYDQAILRDADDALAFYNRGSALEVLGRLDEAAASLDRAIALNCDYVEAYVNRGHVLRSSGQFEAAVGSYDEAIKRKPVYAEAFHGRGLCLSQLRRFDEAIVSHEQAIQLNNDYASAHIERANILKRQKRHELAIESYLSAIKLEPFRAEIFEGYGFCLLSCGQIEAAIQCYDRALELEPKRRYLLGLRRHAQMHISDWRGWAADLQRLTEELEVGAPVVQPFILSALVDSPRLQRQAAEIWVREDGQPNNMLGQISRRRRDKIRVGYFSADFRAHPVSLLTAELFETHDRSRFEIIAFASSPDSPDPIRQRLKGAFDRFIDVCDQSDIEVAVLAREIGIDIAVDLGGFTVNSRTGIFALRSAPIQLSYIGYLGTMAAPYMDYLVADETIVPAEIRQYYSEKIIYLPCYQVNDSLRQAADRTFERDELGLPATGFVFCCFNATYKLTPETFETWMRILRRVGASSLFLYVDNSVAQVNLSRQAERHEIDPARIVFGKRVPLDQYLARFRAMDLFLDTTPYNAGATASDALWAGLPVLTCLGQAFASRYAASILQAADLPELVTTSIKDYEDMAVRLATTPKELASLRDRLERNRGVVPLFNTPLFTRNLEYAFTKIYERWLADLPPIDVYPAL